MSYSKSLIKINKIPHMTTEQSANSKENVDARVLELSKKQSAQLRIVYRKPVKTRCETQPDIFQDTSHQAEPKECGSIGNGSAGNFPFFQSRQSTCQDAPRRTSNNTDGSARLSLNFYLKGYILKCQPKQDLQSQSERLRARLLSAKLMTGRTESINVDSNKLQISMQQAKVKNNLQYYLHDKMRTQRKLVRTSETSRTRVISIVNKNSSRTDRDRSEEYFAACRERNDSQNNSVFSNRTDQELNLKPLYDSNTHPALKKQASTLRHFDTNVYYATSQNLTGSSLPAVYAFRPNTSPDRSYKHC